MCVGGKWKKSHNFGMKKNHRKKSQEKKSQYFFQEKGVKIRLYFVEYYYRVYNFQGFFL